MNKEEALNKIIEYCKNGSKTPVSDFCRIPCSVCPFNDDNCENVIADVLTERLLKAEEKADSLEETCYKLQQALEEKKETNLEHYIDVIYMNDDVCGVGFKEETAQDFNDSQADDFYAWLLLPYEPKRVYKLMQFEYDLLKVHAEEIYPGCIHHYWELKGMCRKGYFKGIPTDIPVGKILDNCEVIQND